MRLSYGLAVVCLLGGLSNGRAGPRPDCDPFDVRLVTTPAPPLNAEKWRLHERMKATLARPADTVIVGDSLAQGWPKGNPSVLNLGVGSDRTQNVLWRLADLDLRSQHPRLAILIIGTNNLGTGDPACAVETGIRAVADRLTALWPAARLVVVAVPPRGPDFRFRNEERLAVNAGLRAAYRNSGTVSVLEADAELSCGFTQPCGTFLPDALHFAPQGYVTLERLIDALLARASSR